MWVRGLHRSQQRHRVRGGAVEREGVGAAADGGARARPLGQCLGRGSALADALPGAGPPHVLGLRQPRLRAVDRGRRRAAVRGSAVQNDQPLAWLEFEDAWPATSGRYVVQTLRFWGTARASALG